MTTQHAAVRDVDIVDGQLHFGGMSLTQLAQRVGRTPFYAYDRQRLQARVQKLRDAIPREVSIHYAVKANPMPALVALMAGWTDGVDVASAAELQIALDVGADVAEVSFAGPGKSVVELERAVHAGVLLNIESMREIRLLGDVRKRLQRDPRVAVRVNPDFELKSSGMKMGGGPKPFGIDAEQVPAALAEIDRQQLVFEGFHIYSGSQNLNAQAICEAQTKSFDLALRLSTFASVPIKVLNLGGGFGIPYFPGELPLDLAPIGNNLHALVRRAQTELPHAKLVIELGRYLVGEAGIYVCRVIDRKISRGDVFLVTDGGLHHHLAATGNFGQVLRKNYPVLIGNRMDASEREQASVVGPLCTPLDVLAEHMELARASEGDFVVVLQSGAYGLSASPVGFLSHPAPVEVLV